MQLIDACCRQLVERVLQMSAVSCNQTAPYATADNAPAPRRSGYRPTAPFHTEPDGDRNLTSAPPRPPHTSSRANSTLPPFSLHNEASATTGGHARPQRQDSRPGTAAATTAPFDRDDQPPPPPRRAMFRTGYQPGSQCPYDRDDLVVAPKPRNVTSSSPYATCAPSYFACSSWHRGVSCCDMYA